MRGKSIALLALLLLASPLPAAESGVVSQDPAVADAIRLLDLWIQEQLAYRGLPGLSIGIVSDQDLVWARGYAFSDLGTQTPATAATVYRIGSITKLFTSTAILQLRDQGRLGLDDPVSRHLPWFEVKSSFSDAPAITVRHLLTHTSGLPREAAFPYWTDHEFPTREQIIEVLPSQAAVFAPATTYKYSNLGMALLGEIVAAVSGEPYPEYLRRHVLLPLGMSSSSAVPGEELHRRMATRYMRRMPDGSRGVFDYYDTNGIAPAANMVSTVEDLARFAALQFRDGPAGGEQILSGSTLREMQRPHWVYPSWEGGRGLGFAISRRDGKTIVSHGGWVGGSRTHLLLVPSEKIAVIAMTNADDGNPSLFSYQAYDVVGPAIVQATAPEPKEKRTDAAWERYLGVYADPWGWEHEVMILNDELVVYEYGYPPEEDAENGVTRLVPVDEHTFRMPDGELMVFELDEDGTVFRIKRRYDYIYPRPR